MTSDEEKVGVLHMQPSGRWAVCLAAGQPNNGQVGESIMSEKIGTLRMLPSRRWSICRPG
jgi:hypothetical protein